MEKTPIHILTPVDSPLLGLVNSEAPVLWVDEELQVCNECGPDTYCDKHQILLNESLRRLQNGR